MTRRTLIPGLVALLLSVAGLSLAAAPVMAQGNSAGPSVERYGSVNSESSARRQPLPDKQIWAIAQSRVPGRIVGAHLRGPIYSFRIISQRGSIVDVDVDRYVGRVVRVRGGP